MTLTVNESGMTMFANGEKYGIMTPVNADLENLILLGQKIKEYQDAYNAGIEKVKAFMEENSIKKFENEEIAVTYVEPTYRESFDSKAFRAEHEDIYNDYIKLSPVKASLRIKTK